MSSQNNVNGPPIFDGKKNDIESFITRVELFFFEANPNRFMTDESCIKFMMSYVMESNGKFCSIHQKKFGNVREYIQEFQQMSQNSDFNEICQDLYVY
ncbi:hypothetical protein PIROE2DRAFT_8001 [Piromyces sp. E2]|nr:hypothetical protein PIROE2DRAFT_8001 [Piromyces sp. E2]|eukprot:OUM65029.1 hypothetical protein PIROE2DRAFT_8001 [Piromyces sp. E2]